jgi:hypothetical protein
MKKKDIVKKKIVLREDLGEALQVALRKACDSTPTSLLWNIIYKVDEHTWEKYLDMVYVELQIAEATGTPLKDALRKISKEFRRKAYSIRDDKLDGHGITLMVISFELFNDSDWEGYASFLEYQ